MNAHLRERFAGNNLMEIPDQPSGVSKKPVTTLNLSIREYFQNPLKTHDPSNWHTFPEIPTGNEIGRIDKGDMEDDEVEVPPNKIIGAWGNKEEYLQAHYELLREDAISPLRAAVAEVKANPKILESESEEHAGIYENVCPLVK